MPERTRRIIETAIELADQGGFQAVNIRDVAERAGVALGTLYARFRSKEDILLAALEDEAATLEAFLKENPPQGETKLERVTFFFRAASGALFSRPNFARAILRSVSSGDPQVADKVLSFYQRITALILHATKEPGSTTEPTEEDHQLAFLLQQVWFSALVGWMGGLNDEEGVIEQVVFAADLILCGFDAKHGR
jgi:AcrR family transcriptional regulator